MTLAISWANQGRISANQYFGDFLILLNCHPGALKFTEVHRGAKYGVLALAINGEEDEEDEETMEES